MAVPTPSNGGSGAGTASLTRLDATPASAVLAAAIPFLFFHIDFQPGFTVDVGSASAHAVLSDFAVLAVAVTALVAGMRHGFAHSGPGGRSGPRAASSACSRALRASTPGSGTTRTTSPPTP